MARERAERRANRRDARGEQTSKRTWPPTGLRTSRNATRRILRLGLLNYPSQSLLVLRFAARLASAVDESSQACSREMEDVVVLQASDGPRLNVEREVLTSARYVTLDTTSSRASTCWNDVH